MDDCFAEILREVNEICATINDEKLPISHSLNKLRYGLKQEIPLIKTECR